MGILGVINLVTGAGETGSMLVSVALPEKQNEADGDGAGIAHGHQQDFVHRVRFRGKEGKSTTPNYLIPAKNPIQVQELAAKR